MTWDTRILKLDGTTPPGTYHACGECIHGVPDPETHRPPCYIFRAHQQIGNFLTAIDCGSDGYKSSGTAVLRCNGFKQVTA